MSSQGVHTGIKVIDLLTPIPGSGDVLVTGEPTAASRVLGTELAHRLAATPHDRSRVVVFADSGFEDFASYEQEFRETMPQGVEFVKSDTVTAEELRIRLKGDQGYSRDAFFGVSKREEFVQAFRSAVRMARAASESSRPLLTIVVTESLTPSGFDATLFLSRSLAVEALYPPIDIRKSESIALSDAPSAQRQTAEKLRSIIIPLLEELHPGAMKDPEWIYNRDASKRSAVQALRFMSQPYFCAEPYTGIKAAFVPLESTIRTVEAIIEGKYLNSEIRFAMQNEL